VTTRNEFFLLGGTERHTDAMERMAPARFRAKFLCALGKPVSKNTKRMLLAVATVTI
jgi:hypothetical protein